MRIAVVEGKRYWPAAPGHNLPRVTYHEVFLETPGKHGLPHALAVPKRHVRPVCFRQKGERGWAHLAEQHTSAYGIISKVAPYKCSATVATH